MAILQKENDLLREKIAERDSQIAVLNEQLTHLLSKRFGPSSEKSSPDQQGLFNEAEELNAEPENQEADAGDSTTVKSHTRQRRPRVSIPDNLPREEIIHDLPEAEKICPHNGSPLKSIGSEDHEQLEIIPAKIKVVRHKRLKYACPCCDNHIVTAAKPNNPSKRVSPVPAYWPTSRFKNTQGRKIESSRKAIHGKGMASLVRSLILSGHRRHLRPYRFQNKTVIVRFVTRSGVFVQSSGAPAVVTTHAVNS